MIWDDPWTYVAIRDRETTLFPPITYEEHHLEIATTVDQSWCDFVKTNWTPDIVNSRLQWGGTAYVLQAPAKDATCIVRRHPAASSVWILETLHAQKGRGSQFMRTVISWLWRVQGARGVMFVWELQGIALLKAGSRGWLSASVEYQWGWSMSLDGCNWCGSTSVGRTPLPTAHESAIVSDSGKGDGIGYVYKWSGDNPNWKAVATAGGWRGLWTRSTKCPGPEWRWTGEVVIVAALGRVADTMWVTAEV